MSAFDTAWMVLKMPPLPRGVQDVTGRIGEQEFGPRGSKSLSNRMAFNLGKLGGDADQKELRDFLMQYGDNPEVMDMLASRFGMEPGSIEFPGRMMPRDPSSTMAIPDLPRGLPDMSMMQPEGARTPAPQLAERAPDPNTVPPAPTGDVAVGRDDSLDMLLSQFSEKQLMAELGRRRRERQ